MSNRIRLSFPEPQYADRMYTLARGIVHERASADDVKAELETRERFQSEAESKDLRLICREMWRRNGR
jgi:hypothetical protein